MTLNKSLPIVWESGESIAPRPPVVKGLPILGSALDMRTNPLQFLVNSYHTYGPIFQVRALHRRFTVMAGPEANLFMSRNGDRYLSTRESWTKFADAIDSKYFLAMLSGEDHATLRKVIKKPYSKHALLRRLPATLALTDELISDWDDQTLTVFPNLQKLVAEQIGHFTLNAGPGEYFDDFVLFMKTLLNVVLGQQPKLALALPAYRRAKGRVMDLAQQMLDSHRQDGPQAEPDLIDYMLEASAEHPRLLSEAELLIGAIGPYLAGIDTVAGTLSFMLYALAKDPETLERLRTEVDALYAEGVPDARRLRQTPLLHATVIETLRRYPVSPMLPRTVAKPFSFAGRRLEVGEELMMGIGVAHFDERLYQNPDDFDIDRCLKPREEHKQPGALAPYGLGAHTCAGAGLAEAQLAIAAAHIVHTYDFECVPQGYELNIALSPAPAPAMDFKLRFTKREGKNGELRGGAARAAGRR